MTAVETTTVPPPGLSSREVAELADITYRQLDYWTRTGIIEPDVALGHGSGSRRRWSPEAVAAIAVLARLRSLGVDLAEARQVLPVLATEQDGGFGPATLLFISDGQVWTTLPPSEAGVFVDVAAVRRRIAEAIG